MMPVILYEYKTKNSVAMRVNNNCVLYSIGVHNSNNEADYTNLEICINRKQKNIHKFETCYDGRDYIYSVFQDNVEVIQNDILYIRTDTLNDFTIILK